MRQVATIPAGSYTIIASCHGRPSTRIGPVELDEGRTEEVGRDAGD